MDKLGINSINMDKLGINSITMDKLPNVNGVSINSQTFNMEFFKPDEHG